MENVPLPLERWLTRRNARIALVLVALVSLTAAYALRNVRLAPRLPP